MLLATEKKTMRMRMSDRIPNKAAMVRSRSLDVHSGC